MQKVIFGLIMMGILALIDFYVFQAVKTSVAESTQTVKRIVYIAYWSLTAFTFISIIASTAVDVHYWPRHLRTYVFSIIATFFFCKLLLMVFLLGEDIIRLIRFAFMKLFPSKDAVATGSSISRSQFLSRMALLAAGIPMAASFYGIIVNAYNYKVHRIGIKLPNLPSSFDGLKIVQISDVHSGSFSDKNKVTKGIKMILDLKPDLIFFTGDLVNDIATEMDDYKDLFAQLQAPLGVYSCTGNHDYGDYVQWESKDAKAANFQRLMNVHKELGWHLLMNDAAMLEHPDGKVAIIGIENWSNFGHFPKYGKMHEAYPKAAGADVKLLLSHDPTHWDTQVRPEYPDIDIAFAGHTHGFQMGVETKFFRFSPSQFAYKQWAGLYQEGKQYLYVNRGYGFLGYPGRIGILPEITLMTLNKG